MVIFWFILGIGLPALLLFGKLVTEARDDRIYNRDFPLDRWFRNIAFRALRAYEVRACRPILEYGGWGADFGCREKRIT